MRLINVQSLQLEEYFGTSTPKYAILSHTWGVEEVTFQEFQQLGPSIESKAGYLKIKHTCEQALKYGLQYAWVDTCCINKESSTELSEAINSMFQWYEAAEICFAYLADVSPTANDLPTLLDQSRWFTRGWTLQELLAPEKLDFLYSDWTRIASRIELADQISHITGIREEYLGEFRRGSRQVLLSRASVAERMSWASRRTTTRAEDTAYSLLGIFGINMSLIYGEGMKSFQRLQQEILRNTSELTLLAWNIDYTGQPQRFNEPESHSAWLLALKMLAGRSHPWCASSSHETLTSLGILAPNPTLFRYCADVEPCEINIDWATTSRGLRISLPLSQDEEPYVMIPCRLRQDPRYFLAVPLTANVDNTYSRSESHSRLIHHTAWQRWRQSDLTLAMAEGPDDLCCALWIRELPSTLEVSTVYTMNEWRKGGSLIRIPSTWCSSSPLTEGSSAVFLEDRSTKDSFAIIINVVKTFPRGLQAYFGLKWEDGAVNKVECRFIRDGSRESVVELVHNPSAVKSLPCYLDGPHTVTCSGASRKMIVNYPVFELDIRIHLPGHLSRLRKRLHTLKCSERVWTAASFLSVTVIVIVLNIILIRLGWVFGTRLVCWNQRYGLHGNTSPDGYLDMVYSRLRAGGIWYTITYQLVPIACYFFPMASEHIRQKRWLFALLLDTPLLLYMQPGAFSFLLVYGFWPLSLLFWRLPDIGGKRVDAENLLFHRLALLCIHFTVTYHAVLQGLLVYPSKLECAYRAYEPSIGHDALGSLRQAVGGSTSDLPWPADKDFFFWICIFYFFI